LAVGGHPGDQDAGEGIGLTFEMSKAVPVEVDSTMITLATASAR
jgi:hypothetical protein